MNSEGGQSCADPFQIFGERESCQSGGVFLEARARNSRGFHSTSGLFLALFHQVLKDERAAFVEQSANASQRSEGDGREPEIADQLGDRRHCALVVAGQEHDPSSAMFDRI